MDCVGAIVVSAQRYSGRWVTSSTDRVLRERLREIGEHGLTDRVDPNCVLENIQSGPWALAHNANHQRCQAPSTGVGIERG